MMIMLVGGPRDGDIVEIGDGFRTVKVPVISTSHHGYDVHEYEVMSVTAWLGQGRQIGAAKYRGMRVEPQMLIQEPERNNYGQQKQEISKPGSDDLGGDGDGEPSREVSRPSRSG